jgi:hypothetical protein
VKLSTKLAICYALGLVSEGVWFLLLIAIFPEANSHDMRYWTGAMLRVFVSLHIVLLVGMIVFIVEEVLEETGHKRRRR